MMALDALGKVIVREWSETEFLNKEIGRRSE